MSRVERYLTRDCLVSGVITCAAVEYSRDDRPVIMALDDHKVVMMTRYEHHSTLQQAIDTAEGMRGEEISKLESRLSYLKVMSFIVQDARAFIYRKKKKEF
jgi:hypothetical protein